MLRLPSRFAAVILAFAPLFLQRSWRHAQVLLLGAILAPGQRTVTSLLRNVGLARECRFVNYHRVLSRAAWSPRAASRVLLGLLVAAFAPTGPVLLGLDDTIERRRGKRIAAKGIYRDPVRSSHGHFVKASGLRRLTLMLVAPVPWAGWVWALPFLTALAPSERYCQERGRRHKTLTDWGRQLVLQARRWLPRRLADPATTSERLVVPLRWVLIRDPRGRFSPQALLCTDPAHHPLQVVRWSVQRWQLEVTFREVRGHLGVETQRQWSDLAIARTTPCLLGLFSLTTLLAARLAPQARRAVATTAWYRKRRPTFSDSLAAVRRHLWTKQGLLTSGHQSKVRKPRPALRDAIAYALCQAA